MSNKNDKTYGTVRGSYDNYKRDDIKISDSPALKHNDKYPSNSSVHVNYQSPFYQDRPRSREIMRSYPPPQGYGMPQFVPMYMPMPMPNYGGFPGYGGGYGYGHPMPYGPQMQMFPQPFHYGSSYEKRDDLDRSEQEIDVRASLKKKDKFKSAEQIINEFKAYTLPKLRLKRLIKLQAVMKGYYVRRFKYPVLKRKRKLYKEIAKKKLEEFLEVQEASLCNN
jgi:hypothetical protein